ncbi:hypothetical protein P7K49_000136, partial [Saguinus oedipus]
MFRGQGPQMLREALQDSQTHSGQGPDLLKGNALHLAPKPASSITAPHLEASSWSGPALLLVFTGSLTCQESQAKTGKIREVSEKFRNQKNNENTAARIFPCSTDVFRHNADQVEANPQETNPQRTNPQEANPQGANPQGANPQGTNPQEANPQGANPQEANPQGMPWPGADGEVHTELLKPVVNSQ